MEPRTLRSGRAALLAGAVALLLAQRAVAHGDDHMGGNGHMMKGNMSDGAVSKPDESSYPPTYFTLPDHRVVIVGHIAVMSAAWIIVLPVAVMFSLARSRYTLPTQVAFAAANALGVLLSTIYNAATPDLYPGNAHHRIGWVATWVVGAQLLVSLLGRVAGAFGTRRKPSGPARPMGDEMRSFLPAVSTANMAEHLRRHNHEGRDRSKPPSSPTAAAGYRLSNDSGQGTEPNTESLQGGGRGRGSSSSSSSSASPPIEMHHLRKEEHDEVAQRHRYDEYDDEEDDDLVAIPGGVRGHSTDDERRRWGVGRGKVGGLVARLAGSISTRAWKILLLGYNIVDRTILPLGFIALTTGIVTYARFFEGREIFTGLAHWIKGGVFFWLGIGTLGRWSGSFGDLGWAWNLRPKRSYRWRPTAEWVESFLIFFYGSTNIFLEHLGGWGGEWSAQDLEHISITVLFIGGGLCGMLIESTRIRDLLNTTVADAALEQREGDHQYGDRHHEGDILEPPESYEFSLNPIPALVILLLGIMMGSHTQTSMVSSMVHKQWGNLLTGASFARALTYVLLYLRPPRSVLPSRPPTELLTAFGLIAGGIIFMASSGDTVAGMEHYDLDAMFIYTVTMGFVGLLMAWVLICLALKGWAVRKEAATPARSRSRIP